MSCWCEFKDDTIYFKSNKLTCAIFTKDEDDNIYRPKGNLVEFYANLKNKLECTMYFDCKDKNMKISYPEYDHNFSSKKHVKFEINGVIILVEYDSCFDAICEFLKQFQFIMLLIIKKLIIKVNY